MPAPVTSLTGIHQKNRFGQSESDLQEAVKSANSDLSGITPAISFIFILTGIALFKDCL